MTCSIERTLVLKIQMQIDANQEGAVVISKEERKGQHKILNNNDACWDDNVAQVRGCLCSFEKQGTRGI